MSKPKWKIVIPKDFSVTKKNYNISGRKYVRVTRSLDVISKPGLIIWFQKVGKRTAEKIMKDRQILGTQAHNLFEKLLKKESFEKNINSYPDEVQMDVRLFKHFMEKCIISIDALEQRLWSKIHRYAGTADFIGYYKTNEEWLVKGHKAKFLTRSFVLGDWKTSRDIYPEYWLQLAAYCIAFKELTGIEPDGAFIAHFRNGKIRIKEKTWKELTIIFKSYLHVLGLYDGIYNKIDYCERREKND